MTTTEQFPKLNGLAHFYGKIEIGTDGLPTERWERRFLTTVMLPYRFRLAWQTETMIRYIRCHRAVSKSLTSVLHAMLAKYGSESALSKVGLDLFGGCYLFELENGVLTPAAYGAAISINPAQNPIGKEHGKAMMPEDVAAIFEEHGWRWGAMNKRAECGSFYATS